MVSVSSSACLAICKDDIRLTPEVKYMYMSNVWCMGMHSLYFGLTSDYIQLYIPVISKRCIINIIYYYFGLFKIHVNLDIVVVEWRSSQRVVGFNTTVLYRKAMWLESCSALFPELK